MKTPKTTNKPAAPKAEPRTRNKSIRATPALWAKVDEKAKALGITPNVGVVQAMEAWVGSDAMIGSIHGTEPVAFEPPRINLVQTWNSDESKYSDPKSPLATALLEGAQSIPDLPMTSEQEREWSETFKPSAGSLVSTPPGAKMGAPREPTRWDWAKPERKKK